MPLSTRLTSTLRADCWGGATSNKAGNQTTGFAFTVPISGSQIVGFKAYLNMDLGFSTTWRCKLWEPNNAVTPIRTADIVVPANSPGFYTVECTPLTIEGSMFNDQHSSTIGENFCVSIYELTGSYVCGGSPNLGQGSVDSSFYMNHNQLYYNGGDARPATLAFAPVANIMVLMYVWEEFSDIAPPYLRDLTPDAYESSVLLESNIKLSIIDDNSKVDGTTVKIRVDGHLAWENDLEQTGFSVSKAFLVDGYSYVIDPDDDFLSYSEILINAYAKDFRENLLDSYYTFQTIDIESPFVINQVPIPGGTNIYQDISIEFDVYGRNSGADQYSIDAYVGGLLAMEDGGFISPFDGSGSSSVSVPVGGYDGYHITIARDYSYQSEDVVQVNVYAVNMDGY